MSSSMATADDKKQKWSRSKVANDNSQLALEIW